MSVSAVPVAKPRSHGRVMAGTLASLLLAGLPASALAAGAFDSASASASRSGGRWLAWKHHLGSGADRILVVAVTIEDNQSRDPGTLVLFGHRRMSPVPGGIATASKGKGKGVLRTQLYYLLESSLPRAGRYPIVVLLGEHVSELAGGAISLSGLGQLPPEAVAAGVTVAGARVVTTLTTSTPRAWIVDAVGADVGKALSPGSPEQSVRLSARSHDVSVAGSAASAEVAGAHTLAWTVPGKARLAHVAVAFAPRRFALSVDVVGQGTVEPAGGSFPDGSTVELSARPAAGHRFVGWSGDVTGAANPVQLTMDAAKHVVATFEPIPVYSLTTATTGRGSVTRSPDQPTYFEGTVVELQAVPAPGWVFAGWSGDASGTSSPLSVVMDRAKSVDAAFQPDFSVHGWATAGTGTTGGEGGPEVVVDTLAALRFYADQAGPYVIKIAGTIIGNEAVRVRSDKSILGLGSDARLLGVGLQIGRGSEFGQVGNVIVRNLRFEKARAPLDAISVRDGAHNVWIDHCDFLSDRDHDIDFYDGLVDVTNGADFVTVSWSRFSQHFKTSLVGSGDSVDEDPGHLTVTYDHNSFIDSGGRNPSVRFGLVHVYNNYYRDLDDYGVASRMNAEVVVENNWFENVARPIRADTSLSPVAGRVRGTDTNVYLGSGPNSITTDPATWVPPYSYVLDPVAEVPDIVARWAGVGIVMPSGEPPAPTAPTITMPPAPQTVEPGQGASFSVLVDGTYPFTYQWQKDGSPIPGATADTLTLTDVQEADEGSYTVEITNTAGSVLSPPATLTVETPPPPPPPSDASLRERFADGDRTTQALPESAAWFTSSGSNNLVASPGEMRQIVSSSRTLLAYFTNDQGAPVSLAAGESLTLGFTFRFAGFDSAAPPSDASLRVGLLRSVANPGATSGVGFVANGSPNTNARMSGDFGSSNPGSNAFLMYGGYAAFTSANAVGTATPIRFHARTGSNASLIGSTSPYTQLPSGSPTASLAMVAGAHYRGTLRLVRTAAGMSVSYAVTAVSDGSTIMSHASEHAGSATTAFDTAAFFLSKNAASATYDFIVSEVDVERGPAAP